MKIAMEANVSVITSAQAISTPDFYITAVLILLLFISGSHFSN